MMLLQSNNFLFLEEEIQFVLIKNCFLSLENLFCDDNNIGFLQQQFLLLLNAKLFAV